MSIPVVNPADFVLKQVDVIDPLKVNKKHHQHQQWDAQSMEILSVGLPERVLSQNILKKFKITVQYQDKIKSKRCSKTIFFGDDNDFYFNKDQDKRLRRIVSMKHTDNPLHPNYWRLLLLNAYDSPAQGMKIFTDYFFNKQLAKIDQMVKARKKRICPQMSKGVALQRLNNKM